METLSKLFGSSARVKIMRLFLAHPGEGYDKQDIISHAKVSAPAAQREANALENAGFLRKEQFVKEETTKGRSRKKRVSGYALNPEFVYRAPLEALLLESSLLDGNDLVKRLGKGKFSLVVAGGVFVGDALAPADLLIVGDKLKRASLEAALRGIEAETGRDLRYAIFETPEFKYRLGMYDKFLREVFDRPHQRLVEKIRFE